MISALKKFLRTVLDLAISISVKTTVGRYLLEKLLSAALERTASVEHKSTALTFSVPNTTNHFRIKTFSTKEPETLDWIDAMEEGSVLWDVGANVGLYSCYAAKRRNCSVVAFEPSVFNLELLARNIFLNDLVEKIVMMPLPLSNKLATSTLNMSMTEWGGALSTFGESYSYDGKPLEKVFEFQTLGLSMDEAHTLLRIPRPDYIKIDVDGIEHLILQGGLNVLTGVKGVLIEINDEFMSQSLDADIYLKNAGLVMVDKRHFDISSTIPIYNQIWQRAS